MKDDWRPERIPQVIAYFSPIKQWAYLVTERIHPILPADASPKTVVKAIRGSVLSLPPLASHSARSEAAATAKDFEAPLSFSNVEALQKYMNWVCLCSCFSLANWPC